MDMQVVIVGLVDFRHGVRVSWFERDLVYIVLVDTERGAVDNKVVPFPASISRLNSWGSEFHLSRKVSLDMNLRAEVSKRSTVHQESRNLRDKSTLVISPVPLPLGVSADRPPLPAAHNPEA